MFNFGKRVYVLTIVNMQKCWTKFPCFMKKPNKYRCVSPTDEILLSAQWKPQRWFNSSYLTKQLRWGFREDNCYFFLLSIALITGFNNKGQLFILVSTKGIILIT